MGILMNLTVLRITVFGEVSWSDHNLQHQ